MKLMKTVFFSLITAVVLAACGSVPKESPARPWSNAEYKMELAGVAANLAQSNYRYGFTILLKTAPKVASVRVERIAGGQSETIIDDSANPTTRFSWQPQQPKGARTSLARTSNGFTWMGQSAVLGLNERDAPWLYAAGDTRQVYRFTVRDVKGRETVWEQSVVVAAPVKRALLSAQKKHARPK
ncbi:hypothetical protein [Neisseria musculi]|uniref:Lipoprotein n=1 Tax=Neisseria musculi TaxID=1815583 RepID=A0A7H1M8A7_9NEIS|nr:hypothetical protein [Neisseria musculi]QNT57872.1 hypothetical protein H7A79_2079 [Neisseria musculi]